MVAAILILAVVTPALADKGGAPNANSDWGHLHNAYGQMHGPGSIGDVMSNSHWGKGDMDPPPYRGGIQPYAPDILPIALDGD